MWRQEFLANMHLHIICLIYNRLAALGWFILSYLHPPVWSWAGHGGIGMVAFEASHVELLHWASGIFTNPSESQPVSKNGQCCRDSWYLLGSRWSDSCGVLPEELQQHNHVDFGRHVGSRRGWSFLCSKETPKHFPTCCWGEDGRNNFVSWIYWIHRKWSHV